MQRSNPVLKRHISHFLFVIRTEENRIAACGNVLLHLIHYVFRFHFTFRSGEKGMTADPLPEILVIAHHEFRKVVRAQSHFHDLAHRVFHGSCDFLGHCSWQIRDEEVRKLFAGFLWVWRKISPSAKQISCCLRSEFWGQSFLFPKPIFSYMRVFSCRFKLEGVSSSGDTVVEYTLLVTKPCSLWLRPQPLHFHPGLWGLISRMNMEETEKGLEYPVRGLVSV